MGRLRAPRPRQKAPVGEVAVGMVAEAGAPVPATAAPSGLAPAPPPALPAVAAPDSFAAAATLFAQDLLIARSPRQARPVKLFYA